MLTHERLLKVLNYDLETGTFTSISTGRKVGVGRNGQYGSIGIDGKSYKAHRIAWFFVRGVWPKNDIDHRDLDRTNNKFANLREGTRSQNKRNCRAYSNNKIGLKGVSLNKRGGKYRAQISINGSTHRIGSFETPEAAHAAYAAEAKRLFGEFAREA